MCHAVVLRYVGTSMDSDFLELLRDEVQIIKSHDSNPSADFSA